MEERPWGRVSTELASVPIQIHSDLALNPLSVTHGDRGWLYASIKTLKMEGGEEFAIIPPYSSFSL